MKEFTYVIQDAEGLHARPAGLIVKLAQTMDSRVTLTANEKTADCKRLFAVGQVRPGAAGHRGGRRRGRRLPGIAGFLPGGAVRRMRQ